MRVPFTVWLVGLSCLCSGCSLFSDSAGLLTYKMRQAVDDCFEQLRNQRWAALAWDQVCQGNPCRQYTDDYARGFKYGFADYLYQGGTGEPPLVAPGPYRGLRYQTATGYLAIQDWFAGYRHGAAAARQSGLRCWVTGPTSLRPAPQASLPPAAGTSVGLSPPSPMPENNWDSDPGVRLGRPGLLRPDTPDPASEADSMLPFPGKDTPAPGDERTGGSMKQPSSQPSDPAATELAEQAVLGTPQENGGSELPQFEVPDGRLPSVRLADPTQPAASIMIGTTRRQ
jgi:hypothetical protein